MRHVRRWTVGLLVLLVPVLSACAETEEEAEPVEHAAVVEPVEGSDIPRLILTSDAVERLDVRTSDVLQVPHSQTLIPYAAVFYTAAGDTWTYTNPEPLTFVRESIVIDHIHGDRAFLTAGPPVGTAVVTLGSAELFGTETGVEE